MLGVIRLVAAVMGKGAVSVIGLLFEIAIGIVVYLMLSLVWCLKTKNDHFYRLFGKWLPKRLAEK